MTEENKYCAYPKCGKELIHTVGRRKKKYCDQNCNTRHWQMLHPKHKGATKRIPISELDEEKLYKFTNGVLTVAADSDLHKVLKAFSEEGKITSVITPPPPPDNKDQNKEVVEPKNFNQLLALAKSGNSNKEEIEKYITKLKLPLNQQSLIRSKI